jgi:hypothetical protein
MLLKNYKKMDVSALLYLASQLHPQLTDAFPHGTAVLP